MIGLTITFKLSVQSQNVKDLEDLNITYYAALDVSLRSVSICLIDDEGSIQFEAKVSSDVESIVYCLKAFSADIVSIGFEAGALTQYLTYGLQAAGYDVICLEARQVSAALSVMRNKTDKNDARSIAQILQTGWYNRVHVKSFESHLARTLLTSRQAFLKKCVDLGKERDPHRDELNNITH